MLGWQQLCYSFSLYYAFAFLQKNKYTKFLRKETNDEKIILKQN